LPNGGQGLPICIPDRPMRNIGELGYVFAGEPWRSLDLTDASVARFVERFTVQPTVPRSRTGLVNAGTTNKAVLDTLFAGIRIGITNSAYSTNRALTVGEVAGFTDALLNIDERALTREQLLLDIGTNAFYQTQFPTDANPYAIGTDTKEDVLRGVAELVTFRHQLFLVVVAAQAVSPGGARLAEQRAMALVWRDAYTGQYFIRWQIPIYD